ncbi:MAG TPA: DUF4185 domain-containing protein [Polyangiaceae bacterium]|nr:DUF4185 domain-containing protein [Polyangiaceae bacterium]
MRLGLLAPGALLVSGCLVADPDLVTVIDSREVGSLESSAAIQGRDGGSSGRVWDRVVFAFGDTVLNVPDTEGENWHHNSFSFTSDRDASDGIGPLEEPVDAAGAPRYFIAPTEEEAAFNRAHRGDDCAEQPCGARWAVWPGEPIWDAARARALVFYGLIYAEPGAFNFHGVGQSIAVWTSFDSPPERPLVAPNSLQPTLIWGENEDAPGIGGQIVGDEIFSFACGHEDFSNPCRLMSAPLEHVLERESWRFWAGAAWSPRAADALELFDGAPIMSLDFNVYLDAYVVVYSAQLSDEVVMRTAPELVGPWSEPKQLFTANHGASDGFTYDAVAHAEFQEDGGRVMYVTHSQPTGETWFSTRFPVMRVELLRRKP